MKWTNRAQARLFEVAPGVAHAATRWVAELTRDQEAARNHAAAVDEALREVGLWSKPLSERLSGLHARVAADLHLIRFGAVGHVKSLGRGVTGPAAGAILEAVGGGSGVIFGCTHIGLFHHALIEAGNFASEIMVVTGNQNYSVDVVKRLEMLSGLSIRMERAQTSSAMAIARHLRRGGVVATMLDHYVDTTLSVNAPFFGRAAATPVGIFQIALMTKSPIIPVAVVQSGDGWATEFDHAIQAAGTAPVLAGTVNGRIEGMIRRHADQWSNWAVLSKRWSKAREAVEVSSRIAVDATEGKEVVESV